MKRFLCVLFTVLCAFSTFGCSGFYDAPEPFRYYEYRSKSVFGNGITFIAAVRGGDEKKALDEMYELAEDINSDMSLTLSSSALSMFNSLGEGQEYFDGYASERVEVSRRTYELIEHSLSFYEDTYGLFNIAVYPLTKLWNVDAEGIGRYGQFGGEQPPELPSEETVEYTRKACEITHLKTMCDDGKYYIYKTHPGMMIDLGAVAKGYAADECIKIAKKHGVTSALINISGNLCLMGKWYHPQYRRYVPWELGVIAPRPRGVISETMCALSVGGDRTLVTSGDYERYYVTQSGSKTVYVPHIVNGVSGFPLGVVRGADGFENSADHIVSATIICNDSATADAYATAVCLMDRETAVRFLVERKLHGILVTQDERMCLVGVTESDENGDEYFIRKDGDNAVNGYKRYAIEEYSVE